MSASEKHRRNLRRQADYAKYRLDRGDDLAGRDLSSLLWALRIVDQLRADGNLTDVVERSSGRFIHLNAQPVVVPRRPT